MSSDNFLNVPLNLQTVLKSSYLTKEQSSSLLSKNGYTMDKDLSNINTRVYYNPDENKTLFSIRGTKNLINDLPTDFSVFLGTDDLQKTKRYKDTEAIYKKAKNKYNNLTIVGHSLGGSLANALPTDKNDRVFTYNKGVGLINHNTKANEMALRTNSDIISYLSKNDKHTVNFGGVNLDLLKAHSTDRLRDIRPIRI
jgi:hypothetical protein